MQSYYLYNKYHHDTYSTEQHRKQIIWLGSLIVKGQPIASITTYFKMQSTVSRRLWIRNLSTKAFFKPEMASVIFGK